MNVLSVNDLPVEFHKLRTFLPDTWRQSVQNPIAATALIVDVRNQFRRLGCNPRVVIGPGAANRAEETVA